MPISFDVRAGSGFFVTRYEGDVSNEEHYQAFKNFFNSSKWIPQLNELAIASNVDTSSISYDSLRKLVELKKATYLKHNIKHVKIAIYAPGDLAFGTARIYDRLTDESPEEVRAFRDIRKAIRWLKS